MAGLPPLIYPDGAAPTGGVLARIRKRMTRPDVAELAIELVSPSSGSPVWCAFINDTRTQSSERLSVSYQLDPAGLRATLLKITEYTRAGFTGAGELIAALRMGGYAA